MIKKLNLYPLVLITATLLWGSTFSFTKEIVKTVSPFNLITLRFGVTAIIMFFIFLKGNFDTLRNISKQDSFKFFLLGFLNFISIILQTIGLTEISVSNSGFLTSLAALFVPLFEYVFKKKKIENNVKTALFIAFCGVYLLSFGFGLPDKPMTGDILTIICALFFGYQIVLIDDLTGRYKPGSIMFYCFFITAACALPLSLIFKFDEFKYLLSSAFIQTAVQSNIIFNFTALVILGTVIAYFFMGLGQKFVDVNKAAIIYLLEPVFAALIAILFFGEPLSLQRIVGGLFIIAAQFIALIKINPLKLFNKGK